MLRCQSYKWFAKRTFCIHTTCTTNTRVTKHQTVLDAFEIIIFNVHIQPTINSCCLVNSQQADIEAALKEVCSVLPKTVQNDCDSFVTQYTPEIVKLLAAELSAGEICAALKLCTASSGRSRLHNLIHKHTSPTGKQKPPCLFYLRDHG